MDAARPAERRSDGDSIRVYKVPDSIHLSCSIKSSFWPRSTMDSIRVSEAPDSGSIPDEATNFIYVFCLCTKKY